MIQDRLVEILGAKFLCVDEGFGTNNPVDVVIRPEDVELVKPEVGIIKGRVTSVIFKGVHYEMTVLPIILNGWYTARICIRQTVK